jgi:hypothetical protein
MFTSFPVSPRAFWFCYGRWGIPQLIHHISSALEMSQTVDEFRDDKFFECMKEGRSGDSTEVSQK